VFGWGWFAGAEIAHSCPVSWVRLQNMAETTVAETTDFCGFLRKSLGIEAEW
jgi:hypothetical protein